MLSAVPSSLSLALRWVPVVLFVAMVRANGAVVGAVVFIEIIVGFIGVVMCIGGSVIFLDLCVLWIYVFHTVTFVRLCTI